MYLGCTAWLSAWNLNWGHSDSGSEVSMDPTYNTKTIRKNKRNQTRNNFQPSRNQQPLFALSLISTYKQYKRCGIGKLVNIHSMYPPPQKQPLFFLKSLPSPLNLQTFQAPFLGSFPLYIGFKSPPPPSHTLLKISIFQ